jgi:hypothetical protein
LQIWEVTEQKIGAPARIPVWWCSWIAAGVLSTLGAESKIALVLAGAFFGISTVAGIATILGLDARQTAFAASSPPKKKKKKKTSPSRTPDAT